MPRAFILDMYTSDESHLGQRKFAGLPIRIGRNALNDYQVAQSFVSDFHARIEDVDGQLAVRDLNSKNGIYVRADEQTPPARVRPQEPIFLSSCGFEFFVGPFLRVRLQVVDALHGETLRDFKAHGAVLGNAQIMGPPPGLGGPRASLESLPPAYPNVRPSLSSGPPAAPLRAHPTPSMPPPAVGGPPAYAGGTPPGFAPAPYDQGYPGGRRDSAGPAGPANFPLDAGQPAFRAGVPGAPPGWGQGSPGGDPAWKAGPEHPIGRNTAHFAMSPEALALLGLRELVASLVPGVPLETTGDIARLVTKLHDTVEVFCRCFIPLRDGYAQFVSSMDLQRAALERSRNRSSAYVAVERARDPGAVAGALLNWRDPSLDAPAAIEGIFADLMVHQVALLDGVMKGVRALLDELAPENVERMHDANEGRRPLGIQLGRYKALWETYSHLHELLQEEKQAFSRIFGPEFAQAYAEHRQRRSSTHDR